MADPFIDPRYVAVWLGRLSRAPHTPEHIPMRVLDFIKQNNLAVYHWVKDNRGWHMTPRGREFQITYAERADT